MLEVVSLGVSSVGDQKLVSYQDGASLSAETIFLPVPGSCGQIKPLPIRTLLN